MTSTYITTTIPYVNARPHLGFALELVRPTCSPATTQASASRSGSSQGPTTTR